VAVQEHGRDLAPFLIAGSVGRGLVGALIPVACILVIPLFAMQVGMNPRRFLSLLLVLGDFVSPIEIPLGVPPESLQKGRQAWRRHLLVQRGSQFVDGHRRILRRGARGVFRGYRMVSVMGPEFAHRMGILDREIFEMFSVASSRPAAHPFPFNNPLLFVIPSEADLSRRAVEGGAVLLPPPRR
jgi:hypothetical protein